MGKSATTKSKRSGARERERWVFSCVRARKKCRGGGDGSSEKCWRICAATCRLLAGQSTCTFFWGTHGTARGKHCLFVLFCFSGECDHCPRNVLGRGAKLFAGVLCLSTNPPHTHMVPTRTHSKQTKHTSFNVYVFVFVCVRASNGNKQTRGIQLQGDSD